MPKRFVSSCLEVEASGFSVILGGVGVLGLHLGFYRVAIRVGDIRVILGL